MLIVKSESELCFMIRLKRWNEERVWVTFRIVRNRSIEYNRRLNFVPCSILCWRSNSACDFLALNFKNLETNCDRVLIPFYALKRELNKNVDRFAWVFRLDDQLHLRVVRRRVEVFATTSRRVLLIPLWLKENFSPLLVEEATQIKSLVVEIPVAIRHPEDTVANFSDLLNTTYLILHSFVCLNFSLFVPHAWCVTPVAIPFSTWAPWIPQLDEFVAVDCCDIKNWVGMTLNDSFRWNIRVRTIRRATTHQVVLLFVLKKLVP